MQRLLHEGMDAGLCGFSIQRLGPNSMQADFDGTPMVTDTMCDEDILALAEVLRRARRGLHPDHPGHRRRSSADLAFVEQLAEVAERPDPLQRRRRRPQQPAIRTASRCDWLEQVPGPRACRSSASAPPCAPASPSRSSTGTSTTPPGLAGRHHRHPRREDGQDGGPGAARGAAWPRPRRPTSRLAGIQAGVGGPPENLVVQGVDRQPDLQKYVGRSRSADIAAGRGQAPDRGHARPVARRPT